MRAAPLFLLVFTLVPPGVPTQTHADLAGIHRIYVGSMGEHAQAERFKTLLRDELGKAGFEVVMTAAGAEK
jgi:hypothetical protein